MELVFVGLWVLVTLSVGLISILFGKKYGVVVPIALMASLMGISGAVVNKIVAFGDYYVSAAIIVFSMTFLLTDLISEIWGKTYATLAVWIGFLVSITFLITTQIAIAWPAAPFSLEAAAAIDLLYSTIPRITLASIVAYLIAQNFDVWFYHKLKKLTRNKHMWLRNNGSTAVSQLIDTLIFYTIAFYGVLPLMPLIIGTYIVKLVIAFVDTPFIYAGVYLFNKQK